jgi:hypothetical protein
VRVRRPSGKPPRAGRVDSAGFLEQGLKRF